MKSSLRALALSSLAWSLAACSSDKTPQDANGDGVADGVVTPNNVTLVVPTVPTGHVAGLVQNAATGEPLSGATVTLFGGGISATGTTNERGELTFGPIAAGASFSLHAKADGFADALLSGLVIDDAAGNFPTSNGGLFVGPIGLLPSTGAFSVQVASKDGAPVAGAQVTMETALRYTLAGAGRGQAVGLATSDLDGVARVMAMPDVRKLPSVFSAALVVTVGPVDLDGDGLVDLVGASLTVSDEDVRHGGRPPIIILSPPAARSLSVLASNVQGLVEAGSRQISVIRASENIHLVFGEAIDPGAVAIALSDDTGAAAIPVSFSVGTLGNVLTIDPMQDLEAGKKYGIWLRAQSAAAGSGQTYTGGSAFFARVDPSVPITLNAKIRDRNGDLAWGTGNDQVELAASVPLGRPGAQVPFYIELWLDLDLDGSGTVGDGQGELPPADHPYPGPQIVAATEGWVPAGAADTGFSRYLGPLSLSLTTPRTQAQGPVAFEAHVRSDNGTIVTDVSGRQAPTKLTGSALLQ